MWDEAGRAANDRERREEMVEALCLTGVVEDKEACERRRISGCRFGGERSYSRKYVIHLRLQVKDSGGIRTYGMPPEFKPFTVML